MFVLTLGLVCTHGKIEDAQWPRSANWTLLMSMLSHQHFCIYTTANEKLRYLTQKKNESLSTSLITSLCIYKFVTVLQQP